MSGPKADATVPTSTDPRTRLPSGHPSGSQPQPPAQAGDASGPGGHAARRWSGWPNAGAWPAFWLWLNLAAVVVLAAIRGYGDRGEFRAYQYDLVNFALLAREYVESGFILGIKNDWLNGFGGFTYHWNPMLQPEMVAGLVGRPVYDFGVSVALLLVLMFVTTYALARSLGLPRSLALQAAWIAFMFTPYRWVTLLATEPPYVMTTVLCSTVIICLARVVSLRTSASHPRMQAVWLIAATVAFSWMMISRSFAFVFVAPSLLAQILALAWWWSRERAASVGRVRMAVAGRWIVIACTVASLSSILYALTFVPLAAFSGASLGSLEHDPNGFVATFAGVLANLELPGLDASSVGGILASSRRVLALGLIQLAPALLMLTGIAGAVVWIRRGRTVQRAYAAMTMATIAFIVMFSLASEVVNTQILIRYALLSTLPQLAITATGVIALWRIRRGAGVEPAAVLSTPEIVSPSLSPASARTRRRLMPAGVLVVNVVVAALLLSLFYLRTEPRVPGFPNTLASGPTIAALARQAAWVQGSVFRGRVIALRHAETPEPQSATILSQPWVNAEDLDWTLLALKEYEVPTLAPYGQLISPGLLRVSRDVFGVAGDSVKRNEIITRRLDTEFAQLFGVRYAIADAPIERQGLLQIGEVPGTPPLLVYDVPDANVSGFSPTSVITAADWPGALDAMSAPDFRPQRDVVVDVDSAADLIGLRPAESSDIRLTGTDITVSATSNGRTLLVLPFEFSSCLRGLPQASGDGFVRLQPVDGVLTGVLFDGRTTLRISAVNPPWRMATCRLADRSWWRDMFGPVLLPPASDSPSS